MKYSLSHDIVNIKILVLPVLLALLLVSSSQLSFFLFHTLAEFFTVFVEGERLNHFKLYNEYIIIGILLAAMFYLYRQGKFIDQRVYTLLILSITLSIISEQRGRQFDPDVTDAFLENFSEFEAITNKYKAGTDQMLTALE